MGKIKNTRVLTSDPETISAPRFNFLPYHAGEIYHNDGHNIDFVTDNKSLYVCLPENLETSKENIAEQEGLLKLVSQGEQGVPGANGNNGTPGVTPRIDAHFDGKQMIVTVDGRIKAVSPDLGGPSWKPVVDGTTLSWELTTDRYSPAPIDLTTLRPISEHPILLRTNSDNTKYDWETSGPANYIQWKYEGDEYWNNLISISELMNLALAGVSFWYDEDAQEWHFGHKEVIRASYTADKNGRKIISDVELGDVLFDAGAVPMPNYEFDIQEIQDGLEQIQTELENYATKDWVEGKGYLTGVDLYDYAKKSEIPGLTDAYTKAESDAKYQPKGSYLTAVKTLGGASLEGSGSLPLATINGEHLLSNKNYTIPSTDDFATKAELSDYVKSVNNVRPDSTGNVTISIGNLSFDVKIENNSLYKSTDGITWTLVGSVSGSGEGCAKCWDEDEIKSLISNNAEVKIEEGKLWQKHDGDWSEIGSVGGGSGTVCDECFTTAQIQQMIASALAGLDLDGIVRIADLDGYVKISDLDGYATKTYVESRIQDIISGTTDLDYYRIFLLYQRTNSRTEIPNVPVTGNFVWDTTNGQIILKPEFESNWTNHPENATAEKPYLWMTSATYSYKTKAEVTPEGASSPWETPICLTGEDGQDGADGTNIEFAYILCKETEYAQLKNTTPRAEFNDGRPDDLPTGQTASGHKWEDHPLGISREFPIEAVTIRKKTETGWSDYIKPVIWSKWGEDGVDGDGVEYVFARASEDQVELDLAGDTRLKASYTRPDNSWAYDSPVAPWHDNPVGVTEQEPYVFCSQRKTVDADANEKVWGPWTEPSLWSNYAKKGDPGEPGEPGGPGPAGPAGDQYEYVYALTNSELPITANIRLTSAVNGSTITQVSDEYQTDYYCPEVEFGLSNSSSFFVRCTNDYQSISSNHRYAYVSKRRKHEDVWGPFSAPALYANFVEAGLTEEQLEQIKQKASEDAQENINIAIAEIDAAKERLTATENKLNQIEETGGEILQNPEEAVISIITNYKDKDQKSFADLIVDGKEAQIKQWAGAEVDEKLSDAGITVDGIAATVEEWADFKDLTDGDVSTVVSRLNAQEATIENIAAAQTEQGELITSAGSRLDGLEANATTWANRFNVVEGRVNNVQSELDATNVALTNTAYSGKYLMDDDNNFISLPETEDEEPEILGRNVKVYDTNGNVSHYEIVKHGLTTAFGYEDKDFVVKTYYDPSTEEYVPIYHQVTLDTENDCISDQSSIIWYDGRTGYSATTDPNGDIRIGSNSYPIESGLYAMVLVSEALSQIKQTPGEVDIVANWGADTWAQIIAKANEEGSSITLDADHINLNGDTSATRAAIGNATITDATINNGTITDATINDCTINSHIRSSNYNENTKTGFLIDPQAKKFAFYADNAKFDSINGLEFEGNQTISWSDISNIPIALDDDHLNTIITKDYLQTEKIKSNEIEAGAITGDHIAAKSIDATTKLQDGSVTTNKLAADSVTTDKIAAGAITTDKITVGTLNGDRIQDHSITEDKLATSIYNVTLDLDDNQKPVPVDENNEILYSGDLLAYVGPWSSLAKNNGILLDWDAVYLGKFESVNGEDTITWSADPVVTYDTYNPTVYPNRKITSGNATYWVSAAQANSHRLYVLNIHATISDGTLSNSLIIPVKVVSGEYIGIDYVKFNPVETDKAVEILTGGIDVIKKDSKESTIYSKVTITATSSPTFDTYTAAKGVIYSYNIDGASNSIVFNPNLPNTENERTVHFDKNGNIVSSKDFADYDIYQQDNSKWNTRLTIYLNGNDVLIEDKITLGVGYGSTITDEEDLYVVYPGKNGKSAYQQAVDNGYTGTEEEWLASLKGADGVPYMYQGEWVAGQSYYNNSQRIDLVKNKVNNVTGYYICRKTTNSSTFTVIDSEHPNNDWEQFVGQFQNVATNLLLAEHAYIENLGVGEVITSDNETKARITINKHNFAGQSDNAIKGYAANSNTPGITISGTPLPVEVFSGKLNDSLIASSMVYHYTGSAEGVVPYAYDAIGSSGEFYTSTTNNSFTVSSQYSGIQINSVPTISWRIELENNVWTTENTTTDSYFSLPNMELVATNASRTNNIPLGHYYYDVDEGYMWEEYGGCYIPSDTYNFVLIPEGEYFATGVGNLYNRNNEPIAYESGELYITTESGTISYTLGSGTSTQGVTIAPNGIMVYFNDRYYLQFVQDPSNPTTIKTVFNVNGVNKLR